MTKKRGRHGLREMREHSVLIQGDVSQLMELEVRDDADRSADP